MHIYEGLLSATPAGQAVLLGGTAAAALATAIGLRRLDHDQIPKTALLSSAFFVASFVQVPIYPASVHLLLGGLMGLVLGWSTFPAVLIALLLQAVFGMGGFTTLGVNTVVMALPGVVCHYLFRRAAGSGRLPVVAVAGFAAGTTSVLLSGLLMATALVLSGAHFALLAPVSLAAHLPIAMVEGLVTASVVVLLRQVRPEALGALPLAPGVEEPINA